MAEKRGIGKKLQDKAVKYCDENGVSLQALINVALAKYLKDHGY